jgi:hypothetical protein
MALCGLLGDDPQERLGNRSRRQRQHGVPDLAKGVAVVAREKERVGKDYRLTAARKEAKSAVRL